MPSLLGASLERAENGLVSHLYTSFGAGFLQVDQHSTLQVIVGGGMLVQTGYPWLGLRFDLKSIFYMIPNPNGSDFNADMAISLGPTFIFK